MSCHGERREPRSRKQGVALADLPPHRTLSLPNGRVEKYRPLKLDDVVGNRATIERLKVIEHEGNCPHLMISVSSYRMSESCTGCRIC
jgi:hypothetical protein